MVARWLTHVMDNLTDAHSNVVDHAAFDDEHGEMTDDERELLTLIDAAFTHAHQMRLKQAQSSSV